MKKGLLTTTMLLGVFGLGFATSKFISAPKDEDTERGRVTGIGGIFFKCQDPAKMRAWYNTHLGINAGKYGATFEWHQGADSTKKGYTQWTPFKETTKYFAPSTKDYMVNYRVVHIDKLVAELAKAGVSITDTIATYDYGKFVHIMDIEGNKIELWEPVDDVYSTSVGTTTK